MGEDEIWPRHRGNEKFACYGAVMVYSTLDACPMGLLASRSYTLLHLSVHPPLWLLAPSSSLQWKPPLNSVFDWWKLRARDNVMEDRGNTRAKEREGKGKKDEFWMREKSCWAVLAVWICCYHGNLAFAYKSVHSRKKFSQWEVLYMYALTHLLIHAHCTTINPVTLNILYMCTACMHEYKHPQEPCYSWMPFFTVYWLCTCLISII